MLYSSFDSVAGRPKLNAWLTASSSVMPPQLSIIRKDVGDSVMEMEYFDRSASSDNPMGRLPSIRQAPSTLLSMRSSMQSSRRMSFVIIFTKNVFVGLADAFLSVRSIVTYFASGACVPEYGRRRFHVSATG